MSRSEDSLSLQTLVREQIEGWEAGEHPDAAHVLQEHPELRESKSLVMNLILAEYELRKDAGDEPAVDTLCDRFPDYRQSIVKLLEVQATFDRRPSFAAVSNRVCWPVAGDEFLGYELIEPLGVGGLARVFLAREPAVGNRYVVVKISPFGSREAHTLGKLSHPSIVPIYSVVHDEDGDWTAICMPLLGVATGVDLLDRAFPKHGGERDGALIDRVARETLPLEEAARPGCEQAIAATPATYGEAVARLGLQLSEALTTAHAVGIVHRDIKPSNVLLAWSGRAMLLDFNLSTETGTNTVGLGGTLPYMAPEMIADLQSDNAAAARRFSPTGDIYSLGVVLYELLMGLLPVKPKHAERLPVNAYQPWLEAKRHPIAPLCEAGSAIDPQLAAIVTKCLAFEAAERYLSADELAAALRGYLSRGARLGRVLKRRRREVVLGAIGLLLGGVGLAAFIGTRPTELEAAYQHGLSLYDEGKYGEAEAMFSRCLELKAGWPEALFARAQALRMQQKWSEARADFFGLAKTHRAWGYALSGYCLMRMPDNTAAARDYQIAYDEGLRDIGFLLNFARTQKKRGWHSESVKRFSDVLEIESFHAGALRDRVYGYLAMVVNNREVLPNPQAFIDAKLYRELEPSFEGSRLIAYAYAAAAKKNSDYENEAIFYLREALERGMPAELMYIRSSPLRRLVPYVDALAVNRVPPLSPDFESERTPISEPAPTADLQAFLSRRHSKASLFASGKPDRGRD